MHVKKVKQIVLNMRFILCCQQFHVDSKNCLMHANKWRSSTSEFWASLQACLFAALFRMKALYAQMSHGHRANTRSQATSAACWASVARCIKIRDDVEMLFSEVSKFGQIILFCWAKISSKTATSLYFEPKACTLMRWGRVCFQSKGSHDFQTAPKTCPLRMNKWQKFQVQVQRFRDVFCLVHRAAKEEAATRRVGSEISEIFEFALDAFDFHAAPKCAEVSWFILFQQLCPPF